MVKFAEKRNVDFVDFWGVFPSVGREKTDIQIFDEIGSFLGEKHYGEGVAEAVAILRNAYSSL